MIPVSWTLGLSAVVFVLGHEAGRRQERTWTKRRLDRARRIYIGGMRDW